jgi:hypothetical protein
MRVEVLYSPGCKASKSVKSTLETVIAEERLPVHVEMIETEEEDSAPPRVRIDGNEIRHNNTAGSFEHFRDLLCGRWHELTIAVLHKH